MANFLFPHYLPIKKKTMEKEDTEPLLAEPAQVITYTIAVSLLAAWPVAANDEGWQ